MIWASDAECTWWSHRRGRWMRSVHPCSPNIIHIHTVALWIHTAYLLVSLLTYLLTYLSGCCLSAHFTSLHTWIVFVIYMDLRGLIINFIWFDFEPQSSVRQSVSLSVSYLLSATVDSEKMCLLTDDTITQFHTNQLAAWTGLPCSQSGAAEVPVTHPPTPYYWSSLNKCCARFDLMLHRNNHKNTAKGRKEK